jgi:hypothetical protein
MIVMVFQYYLETILVRLSVVVDVRKRSCHDGKLGQVQIVRAPRLRGFPRALALITEFIRSRYISMGTLHSIVESTFGLKANSRGT